MKKMILRVVILLNVCIGFAQAISGPDLLERSINFHDPEKNWSEFSGALTIVMSMPNRSDRTSKVTIDLPGQFFKLEAERDAIRTIYSIDNNQCKVALNGNEDISPSEAATHNLTCERANLYKNYYTYLYGLPMKLKDPGTLVSDTVEVTDFNGKTYLRLKVSYEETVGSDIWYFYFDPETFAMEIYQFYKTEDNGDLKSESGEYIILSGFETLNGIKIPKIRAWYYNKDGSYLATDTLVNVTN